VRFCVAMITICRKAGWPLCAAADTAAETQKAACHDMLLLTFTYHVNGQMDAASFSIIMASVVTDRPVPGAWRDQADGARTPSSTSIQRRRRGPVGL
jgi:hypothetical protein